MGGLQVKYVELLSLMVEQLFYQNRICPSYQAEPISDISFLPTPECRLAMNRLDFVFRKNDTMGGVRVFARVSGKNAAGDHLLQFQPRQTDTLTFWMQLKNPHLENFNDLPLDLPADRLYYFTNQRSDPAASRTNLPISSNAGGVSGANDTVKKTDTHYHFIEPGVVAAGVTKVRHLRTGAEIQPSSLIIDGGVSSFTFDLRALPSGRCELRINNVVKDEFYFIGNFLYPGIFGVIELSLSRLLDANYRIIETDRSLTALRPGFTILFNNRSTRWRYTMQLQPNSPLYLEIAAMTAAEKIIFFSQLNIVTNDNALAFTQVSHSDHEFVFVSVASRALEEKYRSTSSVTNEPLRLVLKKYIGDIAKEAEVKKNLPYPSTGIVNSLNMPDIYSDIFITL